MLPPESEELEPTASFDLMLAGFERALENVGHVVERRYRFGDRIVCLRFAGPALLDVLGRAIAHLEVDDDHPIDITMSVWDSESTGASLSPLIIFMRSRIAYDHFQFLSPRHEILGVSNRRVPATLDHWSKAFSLYDRERSHGVYWVESADHIPYFERAAPFRTMLSWALEDFGFQSVHAAGVGWPDGGVLLAGPGGSGKSGTALCCLAAGMKHLADDYCLIGDNPDPTAFSMYGVAKLNGIADLQRMPSFLPFVTNPDASGDEKLVLQLSESYASQLVTRFPVRAIVVPRVTSQTATSLAPISAASALRALGPTTLLQRPGAGDEAMQAMSSFVRGLPCFELQLGSKLDDVPRAIGGLLAR